MATVALGHMAALHLSRLVTGSIDRGSALTFMVFIQVQIHGLLVAVGRTSYQSCCNISLFHLLEVVDIHVQAEQLLLDHQAV